MDNSEAASLLPRSTATFSDILNFHQQKKIKGSIMQINLNPEGREEFGGR